MGAHLIQGSVRIKQCTAKWSGDVFRLIFSVSRLRWEATFESKVFCTGLIFYFFYLLWIPKRSATCYKRKDIPIFISLEVAVSFPTHTLVLPNRNHIALVYVVDKQPHEQKETLVQIIEAPVMKLVHFRSLCCFWHPSHGLQDLFYIFLKTRFSSTSCYANFDNFFSEWISWNEISHTHSSHRDVHNKLGPK